MKILLILAALAANSGQAQSLLAEAKANAVNGVYTKPWKAEGDMKLASMQALKNASNAIVVAKPVSNATRLTADGSALTTTIKFVIQDVYVHDVQDISMVPGWGVSVRFAGGDHHFRAAGIWVHYASRHARLPRDTKRSYMLFLKMAPDGVWETVGQMQGVLEIDPSTQTVKPGDKRASSVSAAVYKHTAQEVVNSLH